MRAWNHGHGAAFRLQDQPAFSRPQHILNSSQQELCAGDGAEQVLEIAEQFICVECLRALLWFPPD